MPKKDYDILTVTEGAHTHADLTEMLNGRMDQGWYPWLGLMAYDGFVMQGIEIEPAHQHYPLYEMKLVQATCADDMSAQVNRLGSDGWEPYLGLVAGAEHIFQWMTKYTHQAYEMPASVAISTPVENSNGTVVAAAPVMRIKPLGAIKAPLLSRRPRGLK